MSKRKSKKNKNRNVQQAQAARPKPFVNHSEKKAEKPLAKKTQKFPEYVPVNVNKNKHNVSYTFTDKSVTVHYVGADGFFKTGSAVMGSLVFAKISDAVRAGDMDAVVEALNATAELVKNNAVKFNDSSISVNNGVMSINERELPVDLGKRIITYAEQGLPYDSLVKFWSKLLQNPSRRAVEGLFRFLDAGHFPITEDGDFIGYRSVTEDFKDHHTKTWDNSVGSVVEMPRNMVDEDPNASCSHGLHCAAWDYAKGFGGSNSRLVAVKVDPKDVVSVPKDYNNMKMRVCKFVVVAESKSELTEQIYEEEDEDEEDEG